MKTLMFAAVAAAVSVAAIPAVSQAQDVYGTIGYGAVDIEDAADLGAIQGRLGYKFNPYVAVEGEVSFGVKDDADIELKHQVGAFVVGSVPVTPQASLFARVGYSGATFDTPLGEVDGDGVAYGVGGQYDFTAKDGVRVDWTRHDYDGGDADVLSVSYARKF